MKTLTEFVQELEATCFYGSVELKFENGRITLARKNESIKLDNPAKNYRSTRGPHGENDR